MSNRFQNILQWWFPNKDELQWVLATIVNIEGSSYRKPGARMLINSLGQYKGMLSGGCLEADILLNAKTVIDENASRTIRYDMANDEDSAWALGVGCGGIVDILLQPVHVENQYLQLNIVYEYLCNSVAVRYYQHVLNHTNYVVPYVKADEHTRYQPTGETSADSHTDAVSNQETLLNSADELVFSSEVQPNPKLVIFGGGKDAIPLCDMANVLGWHVTVIDKRTSYARRHYFKQADCLLSAEELPDIWWHNVSATVIMHHNVDMDVNALFTLAEKLLTLPPTSPSSLPPSKLAYIGLLGPFHRKEKILDQLNTEYGIKASAFLPVLIDGPAGYDIGAELPESIALAILSKAHAEIENKHARKYSTTKHVAAKEKLERHKE
ncbi:XdhC family protein [Flocculibacter collagenilyticus]|uniref:XdhC family protein n=1 Tax=Flocculibacter collagenilyticus TaxID=2744479 RepID=UPI0018F3181A|nr:XdhC/CoxI family protein [Flocculibacter collagenilyticus]